MRTAIDTGRTGEKGKQKEVIAWEGESISSRFQRFMCPECLEYVGLDIRGHFRHNQMTAQSIECEKRSKSTYHSPYEKMGLPLYLFRDGSSIFSLFLGFPPVDEALLSEAINNQGVIAINAGVNRKPRISITRNRFGSDIVTRIGLDRLPAEGFYKIEYTNVPEKMIAMWTTHSDMWGYGQFYNVKEDYSTKVRLLGNIILGREYYFTGNISDFWRYKDVVDISEEGYLSLHNKTQKVFKLIFHKGMNSSRFESLASLLAGTYKVNLLLGESRLTPLWPPCIIEENYFEYPQLYNQVTLRINSANDHPTVYNYYQNAVSIIEIPNVFPPTVSTPVKQYDSGFSVDKKYGGNIQFVCYRKHSSTDISEKAEITDCLGNSILNLNISDIKNKKLIVKSSCNSDVFVVSRKGISTKYKIDSEQGVEINPLAYGDSVIVISKAGRQLLSYSLKRESAEVSSSETKLLNELKTLHGQEIDINEKVLCAYRKTAKNPAIRKMIERYIRIGKIPTSVLYALSSYYGGK